MAKRCKHTICIRGVCVFLQDRIGQTVMLSLQALAGLHRVQFVTKVTLSFEIVSITNIN